jgi:predicted metalloprotease
VKWQMGRRSGNVEDRRGMGGIGLAGGGIGAVVIALIAMFMGIDPGVILNSGGSTPATPADSATLANDPMRDFISVVLADTEDTWQEIFAASGQTYQPPTLVLFTGVVQSACGTAQAAVGPFYCPLDQKLYIDLTFYEDLRKRFGAPGDFAQAYVIAHEVGHHVQTLLGTSERVQAERQRVGGGQANALSVRQELQADCYAGLWANHAQRSRNVELETGDIEEALNAASAIGDDQLQKQAGGTVAPETFTHGSSAQRVAWFKRGLQAGDMKVCDTFSTSI